MDKRFLIALFLTGLVGGTMIAIQFGNSVLSDSTFPADELLAKEELIKEYKDEQSALQSRIVFLRKQIESAQQEVENNQQNGSIDLLGNLEEKLGLRDISGEGLEIQLDDSKFAVREGANVSDLNLVQASDIRDIVNLLNAANAEAISVNDQRVIATSPISSLGTTILVNNAYITTPIVIRAVGDKEVMMQRLLTKSFLPSLYKRVKENHLYFKILNKTSLSVPIFNSELKTDHINISEE